MDLVTDEEMVVPVGLGNQPVEIDRIGEIGEPGALRLLQGGQTDPLESVPPESPLGPLAQKGVEGVDAELDALLVEKFTARSVVQQSDSQANIHPLLRLFKGRILHSDQDLPPADRTDSAECTPSGTVEEHHLITLAKPQRTRMAALLLSEEDLAADRRKRFFGKQGRNVRPDLSVFTVFRHEPNKVGGCRVITTTTNPSRNPTRDRRYTVANSPFSCMFTETLIRSRKKITERTDDELMRRVRRGDDAAFRELYNRYKGQLFIYCYRMLNDREGAQDALQEIFVRVHENAAKYTPGTNFAGWVHTIARNFCLNVQRGRKDQVDFDETAAYGQDDRSERHDVFLREKLAEEVAALPAIYREAVILREYEGYSYKQIMEITGQTMATVKFRIFKGREILRSRLGPWLDDMANDRDE